MKKNQNLQKENLNHNFSEFNIALNSYFKINEYFVIPLRIDIKDINFKDYDEIFLNIDKSNNEIVIDYDNPFLEALEKSKLKKQFINVFKFINTYDDLFEEGNIFQHLDINSHEQLFDYFCSIGFTENEFMALHKKIIDDVNLVSDIFMKRATKYIRLNQDKKIDRGKPVFNNSSKADIKNYDIEQTQTYTKLQTMMEYHNETPLFPENINKAYSEWSWREIQLRLMYVMRKSIIDNEIESFKADSMPRMEEEKTNNKQR